MPYAPVRQRPSASGQHGPDPIRKLQPATTDAARRHTPPRPRTARTGLRWLVAGRSPRITSSHLTSPSLNPQTEWSRAQGGQQEQVKRCHAGVPACRPPGPAPSARRRETPRSDAEMRTHASRSASEAGAWTWLDPMRRAAVHACMHMTAALLHCCLLPAGCHGVRGRQGGGARVSRIVVQAIYPPSAAGISATCSPCTPCTPCRPHRCVVDDLCSAAAAHSASRVSGARTDAPRSALRAPRSVPRLRRTITAWAVSRGHEHGTGSMRERRSSGVG